MAVITEAYRQMQRELHERPDYGVASRHFAKFAKQAIDHFGIRSVFDYGAGKRHLKRALDDLGAAVDYAAYDPAFPEYGEPQRTEMVCCIDVLEHVEPDCLDAVLDDLARITGKVGFFTIHTGPAIKTLSDGRNAHLIQEPAAWWLPKIRDRFDIIETKVFDGGLLVIVAPAEGRT